MKETTHNIVLSVCGNAVSNESWEFLRKSHEWPMIDVNQLNPDLYDQIEHLDTSRVREQQLLVCDMMMPGIYTKNFV